MLDFLQPIFDFIIGLGGSGLMFLVIVILSLCFGVGLSKSLEGGLRMGITLTAISAVISILTNAFSPALKTFVESTGIDLPITDLGWAPLAVITWGSIYTILFIFIIILFNLILLIFNKVNTLNVDLFNLWNVSLLGLIMHYYSKSLIASCIFVIFVYYFILKNADLMKNSINDILGNDENSIITSSHPLLLIAPVVMIFDRFIDKFLPFVDKYDFDAKMLDDKIGFWGSKFAIGSYLGLFIGILGKQEISQIFYLAFIGGSVLELLSLIGGWFGPAIEPLSQGVESFAANRLRGKKILIGLDWNILASKPEVWAVTNILAPILLIISLFLPGNKVLPLGGILLTVYTPALLVITKGKVLRMTIIGTILIPLFLWVATTIAPFFTNMAASMNAIPAGIGKGELFSSIDAAPIEKLLGKLLGETINQGTINMILISIVAVIIYIAVFKWYSVQIKNRDLKNVEE